METSRAARSPALTIPVPSADAIQQGAIFFRKGFPSGFVEASQHVVHAPLVATLLADLLRRNMPEANAASFSFRALHPLFDGAPFTACGRAADEGRSVRLWASDPTGDVAFEATATLA